jgi:hypothetical protein
MLPGIYGAVFITIATCWAFGTYFVLIRANKRDEGFLVMAKMYLMATLIAWDMRVCPPVGRGLGLQVRLLFAAAELWTLWALVGPAVRRGVAGRRARRRLQGRGPSA